MSDERRSYRREVFDGVYLDLVNRVKNISSIDLISNVDDVIVYGDYTDESISKLRNIDICFRCTPKDEYKNLTLEDKNKLFVKMAYKKYPSRYFSFWDILEFEKAELEIVLKNSNRFIAVDRNADFDKVTSGKHIYLIKDGKVLDEPLVCNPTKIANKGE